MGLTLLGEMFLFQKHTNRIIQMEKKSNCNIYIAFMMDALLTKPYFKRNIVWIST